MNEEKIRKELKMLSDSYKLSDNPIDVTNVAILKLCRNLLYNLKCLNLSNLDDENGTANLDMLDDIKINDIKKYLYILNNLSSETLNFCKDKSTSKKLIATINKMITQIDIILGDIPTMFTSSYLYKDMEFEKVRLGKDSDDYKHLLHLQSITVQFMDMVYYTLDESIILDALVLSKNLFVYKYSEAKYITYHNILDNFNIKSVQDFYYIKSYYKTIERPYDNLDDIHYEKQSIKNGTIVTDGISNDGSQDFIEVKLLDSVVVITASVGGKFKINVKESGEKYE